MTRRDFAGVFSSAALALVAVAQEAQEDRLEGRVQSVKKDTSTITIKTKENVLRIVVYSVDTKFTMRNQPGSLDQVKDNARVICLGKFDKDGRLMATRIDVREAGL